MSKRIDGITKGQHWTGNSGMGPTVRIDGLELNDHGQETMVRYTYLDTSSRGESSKSEAGMFLSHYHPCD